MKQALKREVILTRNFTGWWIERIYWTGITTMVFRFIMVVISSKNQITKGRFAKRPYEKNIISYFFVIGISLNVILNLSDCFVHTPRSNFEIVTAFLLTFLNIKLALVVISETRLI